MTSTHACLTRGSVLGPAGIVSYLKSGSSECDSTLVFLHPVNTAAEIWRDVVDLLPDHSCVAIDYRGHGSSAAGGTYDPVDYANDSLAVIDDLGVKEAVLIGASIGTAVAIEIAERRPEVVSTIISIGGTIRFGLDRATITKMLEHLNAVGTEKWFSEQAEAIVGERSRSGVPHRVCSLAGNRSPALVGEILRSTFQTADSSSSAELIRDRGRARVFVATGQQDPTCTPAMAETIARFFNVEPTVWAGLGHVPMLESPKIVSDYIESALKD